MTAVEALRRSAEYAFSELMAALEGVNQEQAWAVLPQGGPDYLHSDASIHGITLHVASCDVMYGSVGFRNTEIRWRDCADRIGAFEPDWEAALKYLREGHDYWLASWADLRDDELMAERMIPQGRMMPAWKHIQTVIHHDGWHGGQIAMLRYAVGESSVPPPSVAEDIRKYCADLPSW